MLVADKGRALCRHVCLCLYSWMSPGYAVLQAAGAHIGRLLACIWRQLKGCRYAISSLLLLMQLLHVFALTTLRRQGREG